MSSRSNIPLLPLYNPNSSGSKSANNRLFRYNKFPNEKSLVILLFVVSIITVTIILFNLPVDIQRAVDRESHNIFVPEVAQFDRRHENFHQHAAPPIYEESREKHKEKKMPSKEASDELSIEEKREFIKKMTQLGWSNYEKYAWGENELKPVSRVGHSAGIFGSSATKLGATIVDGLDTLYIMGMHDEFKRGRDWIEKNFSLDVNAEVSAFEANIRFVGGLLSLYALTEDKMFLDKAEKAATLLLPIFETGTGIPMALINPRTKQTKNYFWASGSCSILAEFGTLSLEFEYLSDMTGNRVFADKIAKVMQVLSDVEKDNGLYYNYLHPQTGKWCMKHASMGGLGDSFYEYLLKLWLYRGKSDDKLLDMYLEAMSAVRKNLVGVSSGNLTFFGEFKSGRLERKMDHLSCFSGGLLAMTAHTVKKLTETEREEYLNLGRAITHTCHESYIRSPTRIGPEAFHFERDDQEAVAIKPDEKHYLLRPEVIESYFYMWRLTKEPKYREWAWDAAQAIHKHCRTDSGFSGLRDVYENPSSKDDVQQSFFFAETLKYLYLIFSDDDVIPLDKYVFNSEAHPVLIRS